MEATERGEDAASPSRPVLAAGSRRDDQLDLGQGTTGSILEQEDGFTLRVSGRPSINVRLVGNAHFRLEGPASHERFGLTEPEEVFEAMVRLARRTPKGIGNAVRVRRVLLDPVTQQCARLLEAVPPTVFKVYDALAAVSDGYPKIALCPHLYDRTHLIRDIIAYRSAAIVAVNARSLVAGVETRRLEASPEAAALRKLAQSRGLTVWISNPRRFERADAPQQCEVCVSQAFPYLLTWRDLLSPTGHSYRSLDRTLMNLPPDASPELVCQLRTVRLSRPLTDPLEFRLTLVAEHRLSDPFVERRFKSVFANARAPQIRKALQRVAAHTRNDLSEESERDLRYLVHFLHDFPERHEGTIVGLADKAIRWHRRELTQGRARILKHHGLQTLTTVPPIALPDNPEIRFLRTVEEVVEEGNRMDHCVPSYVPHAVDGRGYLFHVEHEHASATVMVRADGRIWQAQGPRNRRNRASTWGERQLAVWGSRLPQEPPAPRPPRGVG